MKKYKPDVKLGHITTSGLKNNARFGFAIPDLPIQSVLVFVLSLFL